MKRRKILHIPNFYHPNNGGIEKICKQIVENSSNYENKVICFSRRFESYSDTIDDIEIRRVGSLLKFSSQFISISYYFELKKIIQLFDPDLIHFHAPNPLVMFYLQKLLPNKTKLIVHWHSDIVEQKHLYHIVKPFEKRFLMRSDSIIVTSPNYLFGSVPLNDFKSKSIVIPNSINDKEFEINEKEINELNILKQKFESKKIVFFVGRHVTYKGLEYLLESEKFIKTDCVLLIGGTGPLTESLKKQFNSNRIHFIGRISESELKLYYHLADVFAFPSITKNEAFGIVLAEAMYCKTPAVTFSIEGSGVNWVNINNKTGFEVPNGNSILYAEAIDKLLNDDKLRELFANNAYSRVTKYFMLDQFACKINNLYLNLLKL